MQPTEHPDVESLERYVQQADAAEFDELRLHLAACEQCRAEVAAIDALRQQAHWLETPALDEQQQQLIADYVDARLPPEQHAELQQLLQDHPAAMKSALHYASHRVAMESAIETQPADGRPASEKNSRFSAVLRRLTGGLSLRAPLWLSVPATAMAVLLLTLVLNMLPHSDSSYQVVSYQDNPVIHYRSRDSLPGIGFFNRADDASRAYSDIAINIPQLGEVTLHWQQVEAAVSYTMRLQVFHRGEKISLGEVTTRDNRARFTFDEMFMGSRFEWVLSGRTRDQQSFQANGGFVIGER